jgi:hypothetical protein
MPIAVILACTVMPLIPHHAWAAGLAPKYSVYTDDKDGAIKQPEGVACSGNALVVADSGNGRLLRYTFEDQALRGGGEVRLPQMQYPTRVQINSKGVILVFDGRQRRILKVGPDGGFQGYVEPAGIPSGVSVMPVDFKIDSKDNIYLLDIFAGKVYELDPAGKYKRQVGLPKDAVFVTDLCVGPKGDVFVVDGAGAVVYVADKDFKSFTPLTKGMRQYMNFPMYMTADERGTLYIVDQDGGGIVTIGQDGAYQGRQLGVGVGEGSLNYPSQMCITPDGEVIIADRGNNRVQVFTLTK